MLTKRFLHVGCGPATKQNATEGFRTAAWDEVRFDIDVAVAPDIVGSIVDMHMIASRSVDAIYSSHNIEHLYPHEVPAAFREFHRVLNDDGFVVITCPDLRSVCAMVADNLLMEPAYQAPAGPIAPLDILFGLRPAMAAGKLYMAHHCGFTEKSLVAELNAAGFQSMVHMARPHEFDLWVIASKTMQTEATMRALGQQHFP